MSTLGQPDYDPADRWRTGAYADQLRPAPKPEGDDHHGLLVALLAVVIVLQSVTLVKTHQTSTMLYTAAHWVCDAARPYVQTPPAC